MKMNKSAIKNFFDDEVDDRDKSSILLDNMMMLKNMDVREYTLYKKYYEVTTLYRNEYIKATNIKERIWAPTDINDEELTIKEIDNLYPDIILVDVDSAYKDAWNLLRIFGHTMGFDINPGRFIRFLIIDRLTKKYLGVVSIASDVTSIKSRDQYIKWTKSDKFEKKKINHSSIGTCIMALQPLGYNFLGGKLVASLLTTDIVRDVWKEKYGEILIGMTTTSLYGSTSMYNNIPWWRKMGSSEGKIFLKPDDGIYTEWLDWIREEKRDIYDTLTRTDSGKVATSPKQNLLLYMLKQLDSGMKMSEFTHGFQRGVYYAMYYENGAEYLRDEITEDTLILKSKYSDNYDKILDWWKPKAINRYKNLKEQNRLKPEVHFYEDLIGKTWEEAKGKYLKEVGR